MGKSRLRYTLVILIGYAYTRRYTVYQVYDSLDLFVLDVLVYQVAAT